MSSNGALNTPANDDDDCSSKSIQKQSINSATPALSPSSFGLNLKQLQELMELKNVEVKKKVDDDYGGLKEFALKLKTDTMRGLTGESNDLALRVKEFGKNQIPPKPPKSIFRLAFEALQDTTLIMLMICAVISIGLSFYHPPSDAVEEENSRVASSDTANLDWIEGVAVS
jgi:Ca2+ transporting ATPase